MMSVISARFTCRCSFHSNGRPIHVVLERMELLSQVVRRLAASRLQILTELVEPGRRVPKQAVPLAVVTEPLPLRTELLAGLSGHASRPTVVRLNIHLLLSFSSSSTVHRDWSVIWAARMGDGDRHAHAHARAHTYKNNAAPGRRLSNWAWGSSTPLTVGRSVGRSVSGQEERGARFIVLVHCSGGDVMVSVGTLFGAESNVKDILRSNEVKCATLTESMTAELNLV